MAEQKTFHATIARVDEVVFDGEVTSVAVPGVEGDMEVLAGHEALISPLRSGQIRVKTTSGATQSFDLASGTLEVSHNKVNILI
jgi:F-type H+-transporting ATPase subunit epsilon